jgi:hypothetical protein
MHSIRNALRSCATKPVHSILTVIALVFAFETFLGCAATSAPTSSQSATPEEADRTIVSKAEVRMEMVATLSGNVAKDRFVAIVSFVSGSIEGEDMDGKKIRRPLTKYVPQEGKPMGMDTLIIDGKMAVPKKLNLTPPKVGHVTGHINVATLWSGDEEYHRVDALVSRDVFWSREAPWEKMSTPRYVIATGPEKSKNILDATFIGPVVKKDFDNITEAVNVLLASPLADTDKTAAKKMISSKNPWIAVLGLTRLKNLDSVSPKDFRAVMETVPPEDAPGILSDMIESSIIPGPTDRSPIVPELITFLKDANPQRQVFVLRRLNEIVEDGLYDIESVLRAHPGLDKAVSDLVSKRSGDKLWAEVLPEYRKLLALLAEIKKKP